MDTKPKKEVNLLAVIGAVLALVVIVAGIFIWCGHNNKMAKKAWADKDFEAAMEYCGKDFISGKKLIPEIRYDQACELFNSEKYLEAAEIFQEVGATEDWQDAQYMYGLTMMLEGNNQEALIAFENSGEQGFEQWLEIKCFMAYDLYFDEDTEGAIAMLEPLAEHDVVDEALTELKTWALKDAVWDEDAAAVERWIAELGSKINLKSKDFNSVNYFRGLEALRSKDYDAAIGHFELCTESPDKDYAKVFRLLKSDKVMEAAELVGSLKGATLPFAIDSSWIKIFRENVGGDPENNMEDWMKDTAIQKLLSYDEGYVMEPT